MYVLTTYIHAINDLENNLTELNMGGSNVKKWLIDH